ncbi:general stress protein [Salmonella enterica]|nr:general stress protein [Salmonella enterica]
MANHRGGSGNFAEDRERASEAGRKGGQHSGGNFKNDPQRASEAGKKRGAKAVTVIASLRHNSKTLSVSR